jgi:hypothetical protein
MKRFVWAHTAHVMTEEQHECLAGMEMVVLPDWLAAELTFNNKGEDLYSTAKELWNWAKENKIDYIIQPSGSLAFQMALGGIIMRARMHNAFNNPLPEVFYSYSERVSKDIPQEDGSIKNISVFNFEGFYSPSGRELPVGVVL